MLLEVVGGHPWWISWYDASNLGVAHPIPLGASIKTQIENYQDILSTNYTDQATN